MPLLLLLVASFMLTPRGWAQIEASLDAPLTAEDLGFRKASIDVVVGEGEVVLITAREIGADYDFITQQVNLPRNRQLSEKVVILNDRLWNDGHTVKYHVRTPVFSRSIEGPDSGWHFGRLGNRIFFELGNHVFNIDFEVITYANAKLRFPEIPDLMNEQHFWSYNLRRMITPPEMRTKAPPK